MQRKSESLVSIAVDKIDKHKSTAERKQLVPFAALLSLVSSCCILRGSSERVQSKKKESHLCKILRIITELNASPSNFDQKMKDHLQMTQTCMSHVCAVYNRGREFITGEVQMRV